MSLFKRADCVLSNFGVTTAHKFVQIHMNTPNIVYYVLLQLDIQYGYSTTLILRKYFIRNYYKLLKSAASTSWLRFVLFRPHNST